MCVCMCCVTRPLLIEFHNLYVLCELCVKTAREIKEDGSEVAKCARNLGRGCKVHWEGDSNQRAKSTRGVSVGHAASHALCGFDRLCNCSAFAETRCTTSTIPLFLVEMWSREQPNVTQVIGSSVVRGTV